MGLFQLRSQKKPNPQFVHFLEVQSLIRLPFLFHTYIFSLWIWSILSVKYQTNDPDWTALDQRLFSSCVQWYITLTLRMKMLFPEYLTDHDQTQRPPSIALVLLLSTCWIQADNRIKQLLSSLCFSGIASLALPPVIPSSHYSKLWDLFVHSCWFARC